MMVRLNVNDVEVEVGDGATLLEAAQRAGAEVPTLCYLKEIGAITSCMVCVVKDLAGGRMLPACSAKASDGMRIDTDSEEVRAARREILRMLLSEHVGDCEGPCSRICPAGLNIPRMLRHIAAGDMEAAAQIAKRDLIFPATLGHLCSAPCEKGCRRALYDAPVSIRRLHRGAAECALNVRHDERAAATGKAIAVVGGGIAGLSAAWTCLLNGHACRVYEKHPSACNALRSLPREALPREVLDTEIASIRDQGAEFVFNSEAGRNISLDSLRVEFDAVIVACDLASPADSGVFTAQEDGMLVRAVAHGKAAAQQADAFLRGLPGAKASRRYNSQIGRLRPEESAAYAVERLNRAEGTPAETNPAAEAGRCLHCDCLKPVSCRLRRYAEEYEIESRVERHMKRPGVAPIQQFDDVLFEPGKCIKCGICVEITQARSKGIGLTFVGRGLASGVRAPFGESLAQGLGEAALQCVRACPTGALALRNEEETG
jgi:ferredoxin